MLSKLLEAVDGRKTNGAASGWVMLGAFWDQVPADDRAKVIAVLVGLTLAALRSALKKIERWGESRGAEG